MLKNYLTISWRNLMKYKGFSLINIAGLAIGISCCIFLSLYINSELRFDSFHEKESRIFRVCSEYTFGETENKNASTNAVIAEALKNNYREVEYTTRFKGISTTVTIGDQKYSENYYYVDEKVFDIFTYPFISGNPKEALTTAYSIVITKESADKYFGQDDTIGKIIKIGDNENYTVTGVIEDIPRYATYQFDGLCSFKTLYARKTELPLTLTNWRSHTMYTFVLLKLGIDYKELDKKIRKIYYNYVGDELNASGASRYVFLQPLKDIYLRPLGTETKPVTYIYILMIVAIFVLIIACLNYMNLSTARSTLRSREVGIRKTIGATILELKTQFLIESFLITMISVFCALLIIVITLPSFSDFVQRDLIQDVYDLHLTLPFVLLLSTIVGIAAGIYPAFILSRIAPSQIIYNRIKGAFINSKIRKGMVILQFSLSTTLIIATILIIQQINFLKDFNPGFDKSGLVIIELLDADSRKSVEIIKNDFLQNPDIFNAGAGSMMPLWGAPFNTKIPEGYTPDNLQLMHEINVDSDYLPTLGIEFIAGRNFSAETIFDQRNSVIINETAVKKFGWENPIGKIIQSRNMDYDGKVWENREVIGVIRDFHIEGLLYEDKPMFIGNDLNYPFEFAWLNGIAIRISKNNITSTIEQFKKTWERILPGKPFNYYFLEDTYENQFGSIERSKQIFSYFSYLSIFISVLGLFGLVSFMTEKRRKEISIRKVLGSTKTQIVFLLTRKLLVPICIASFIAYPIVYYFINQWLQNFAFKMEIGISPFIFTSGIVLILSFVTVSFQAINSARVNPIESLQQE